MSNNPEFWKARCNKEENAFCENVARKRAHHSGSSFSVLGVPKLASGYLPPSKGKVKHPGPPPSLTGQQADGDLPPGYHNLPLSRNGRQTPSIPGSAGNAPSHTLRATSSAGRSTYSRGPPSSRGGPPSTAGSQAPPFRELYVPKTAARSEAPEYPKTPNFSDPGTELDPAMLQRLNLLEQSLRDEKEKREQMEKQLAKFESR
ncbi:hypothetical protein CYMTET_21608 [Cymbomonas tetramitiformis]|uniref:Uncharacterized protein n=1 Tax=Cymbomonas tetramitiformis TaxID=36881 RepID=A0AAE0G1N9_9CHLO|nr:hypothetical protein CYMTET_21608 [Cymbomonas tetramitiformis]